MALSGTRENSKHIPWFSLAEWHQVYAQIYSNDTDEQKKGYERLLVWKARIPKLPVGVDCTLSLIQVCLRDRELTSRIDNAEIPAYYENDLCLMYSTTIMRFLNHISNVGHTKLTSLFQIAKQLKIPEWIVHLRHDAAHGHELPSVGVLRVAANILLTWLHKEYWAAEAKAMVEYFSKVEITEAEPDEMQGLIDLIELWTAVGLYILANYTIVKDIPDDRLRNALQELRYNMCTLDSSRQTIRTSAESDSDEDADRNYADLQYDRKYKLKVARAILLLEISRYLGKSRDISNKGDTVLSVLLESEQFLPRADSISIFCKDPTRLHNFKEDRLPSCMIQFWQGFVLLLQEKRLLQELILRLLKLIKEECEEQHKRYMASLWISSIARGLFRMKAAQQIAQSLEYTLQGDKKKITPKMLTSKVRDKVNETYPQYADDFWFNYTYDAPNCLTDSDSAMELISDVDSFSVKFIPALLESTPNITKENKKNLLKLLRIYTGDDSMSGVDDTIVDDKIYTVEDLMRLRTDVDSEIADSSTSDVIPLVGDQTVRNSGWTLASGNYDWSTCPIGILPWQVDYMEQLDPCASEPLKFACEQKSSEIVPGIIDNRNLKTQSKINWNNVLREKKRTKRKRQKGDANVIVDRAIELTRVQH